MANIFKKYILPIRPLLIIALFLSVYFFVTPGRDSTEGSVDDPPTNEELTTNETKDGSQELISSSALLPTQSLFGTLFGDAAVDPFLTLPDITPPDAALVQKSSASTPEEEPARSIYQYLVKSSNIGFKANPSRLGLALATAEQGEVDALNNLIAEFEQDTISYAALLPPAELTDIHTASLSLLEKYIAHMRNSRDRADGTVVATWNNSERDVIAKEATRITGQIREIVDNYNISLPTGVLP